MTGTNFSGATAVRFNGSSATFTVNSATQSARRCPSAAASGPVTVTTAGGTATSATSFRWCRPRRSRVQPGKRWRRHLDHDQRHQLQRRDGGRVQRSRATFTVNSATQITATVPAGASSGPVTVTTAGGTATSATSFAVVPAPTITSFSPASGGVGMSVTVTGTNFSGATAVAFNGSCRDLHGQLGDSDHGDGACGGEQRPGHGHDGGRHRDERHQFHGGGGSDDHEFQPRQRRCRHLDHDQRHRLRGATAVAFNGAPRLQRRFGDSDHGDGAGGGEQRPGHGHDGGRDRDELQQFHGGGGPDDHDVQSG